MTPDETVRALKLCAGDRCCEGCIEEQSVRHWQIVMREAADLIESLQAQLAESQRRADAVEMNEDNRVRLLQYDNLRKCFSELCDLILGRKYYNEAMDVYRADEFCCRDIWDNVKPMLSRKQWRGPQKAEEGGTP